MEDLQTTIILAFITTFVAILIAGSRNKIVIYFDMKDLLISFSPWGALILTYILLAVYQHEGELDFKNLSGVQTFILYTGICLTASLSVWSILLCIKYNQNIVLGIIVGIFKTLSALLVIVVTLGSIARMFDDESSNNDNLISLIVFGIIFGLIVWLGQMLINGERVYLAKGWSLPKEKDGDYTI